MRREDFELEVCAGNVESAIAACQGGANRVELCNNLMEGGTTPSMGSIVTAKNSTDLEVYVLVRPRGGDFVYSNAEFGSMLLDIKCAIEIGADGIVTGCLSKDGTIDVERNKQLIGAAGKLPVTFHRAFDLVSNPIESMGIVEDLGFRRILTSGQERKAIYGKELLAQLVEKSKFLEIMPGGGIDESNIQELAAFTGATNFHASLRSLKTSGFEVDNSNVAFNATEKIPEHAHKSTNEKRVGELIRRLMNR